MIHPSLEPLYSRLLQGFSESERSGVKISLFVVSTKTHTLKKIDLDDLTTKNAEKLKKWGTERRFAAVVEKGNEVYAHMSPQLADQIKKENRPLTVEGKSVVVQSLADNELDQLMKISEAVSELLKVISEEQEKSRKSINAGQQTHGQFSVEELFDQEIFNMLTKMANLPSEIKANIIKKWLENRLEIDKRKEEDDRKEKKKHDDIERRRLKKDIEREEINILEIKEQELNLDLTKAEKKEQNDNIDRQENRS